MRVLKSYRDRVGRWIMTFKNKEGKYTILSCHGDSKAFVSFSFPNRESYERELNTKYKPDNLKK